MLKHSFFLLNILSAGCLFAEKAVPVEPVQVEENSMDSKKIGFKFYMNTDENHLAMENELKDVSVEVLKKAKREDVYQFISPLMRLDDEKTIKALIESSKVEGVDGAFTISDLSLVSGKEYLEGYMDHHKPFLLDHVKFDSKKKVFIAVYRLPGDDHAKKLISLKISNIKVKNPDEEIGKFLKKIIKNPVPKVEAVDVEKPVKKVSTEREPERERESSIFDNKVIVRHESAKEPSIFDGHKVIVVEGDHRRR